MRSAVGLLGLLTVLSPVLAEDGWDSAEAIKPSHTRVRSSANSEMEDFVGGVYREKGFAVVLDQDTAVVNGKLILRDRDTFITPKGVFVNDRGTYSSRNGIVVQDRDVFSGKDGPVVGGGGVYFGSGGATVVSTGVSATMRKP